MCSQAAGLALPVPSQACLPSHLRPPCRFLCPPPAEQDIQAHPWFMLGLEPGALNFNDAIVQESLANQPTRSMLAEVRAGWVGWGRRCAAKLWKADRWLLH